MTRAQCSQQRTGNKMKRHPVISFIIGLILSGLVLGAVYSAFLFLTFNLGGGETLRQVENQRMHFLL